MSMLQPVRGEAGLTDPALLPWAQLELPDAWPDALDLRRPRDLWRFLTKVLLRRLSRVRLPPYLPLNVALPEYLLLEFHNLPNGNYSKKVTRGYSTGFDLVMLGEMRRARRAMAQALKGCGAVLDVGCGAGHSTQALLDAGAREVWGLDASPYLLQHAARQYSAPRFVQGLAERSGFPDGRFDGVTACFLFHEMPPRFAEQALAEFRRVLKPGGLLSVLEPAAEQFFGQPWRLLRKYGWRGIYFRWLARFVHEPFVAAWQRRDVPAWLARHGFELIEDRGLFPARLITARKIRTG
jgi:ubiquinone/menaquinone biosynthesis C-methylase UbiE